MEDLDNFQGIGVNMASTEFESLLLLADRMTTKCEPSKADYWRGYRNGIRFYFQNGLPESLPDRYTLMHAATRRNGGDYVYVDDYARGYRDGCQGLKPEDIP